MIRNAVELQMSSTCIRVTYRLVSMSIHLKLIKVPTISLLMWSSVKLATNLNLNLKCAGGSLYNP